MGFFTNLKNKITGNKDKDNYLKSFSNTNKSFKNRIKFLFDSFSEINDAFFEKLMVSLLESDVGYKTSSKICSLYKNKIKSIKNLNPEELYDCFLETIYSNFNITNNETINVNGTKVILLVGVNGSGKTSTAAKLAFKYKNEGKKVCLAAGDTFRAAAVSQLQKFANDYGFDFVSGKENEDPSSVFVEACRYSKNNSIDVLICDTAGRLQVKTNLMKELEKINKVLGKEIDNAPHETYLVIDSNTGQNGISQAELFNEVTKLSGVILTKTDGTSKGGIVLAINDLFNIPVKYITSGESIEDISDFNLDLYMYGIFGELYEH